LVDLVSFRLGASGRRRRPSVQADKKYPVNFRVDYAVGKVGRTITIGVLEAF